MSSRPDRELVHYRGLWHDSARWRGFSFRPGDIVISAPAKCGTTWTQMICALLIFQQPVLERPLTVLSPWLDQMSRPRSEVVADLEAQSHRRFVKTHTPLDGLPADPSVTYICVGRDPRDAALSLGNHRKNADIPLQIALRDAVALADGIVPLMALPPPLPDGVRERFWRRADNDAPPTASDWSLLGMLRHLQTFWDAPEELDVVMLHFDELRTDLAGQMRALADRLAITVPEERWPALVQAATFGEMRARAAMTAPNANDGFWLDNQRFFYQGTSGQWRDILDEDDLERYRARVRAICQSDLVDWVHRGPP